MQTKVLITTNQLSESTKEEMWRIYESYYNYERSAFMARIVKNNYYAFYIHNEELVGFTGLKIDDVQFNNRKVFLIYFGQTIILDGFRGKSLIPITGFKLFLKFWNKFLFSEMYFWADALCYKPYLVFAKTLDEYFPSYKSPLSKEAKEVIDYIGHTHYADSYDPGTGTVRKDLNLVRDPASVIKEKDRQDPDIRFFEEANPDHPSGRGLITLGPGNAKNIKLLLYRYIRSFYQKPKYQLQQALAKIRG